MFLRVRGTFVILAALELFLLCCFAFVAGFVDSIAGGGGLIQLPALFVFLPRETVVPVVLGTNKLSAVWGTGTALLRYAKQVRIPWFSILPAALTAALFSMAGALVVEQTKSDFMKPLALVLLVAVALYTYWKKDLGQVHAPRFVAEHERWFAVLAGAILGFYDGFFGPGMGSFLMFVFIGFFRFDFLTASASSKVINVATNLAAIAVFSAHGNVLYKVALLMGACNIAGALLGTRLAVLKGSKFIRVLFLGIVVAMIARFGYELFWKAA